MRTARITDRTFVAALDMAFDDDITAIQQEEVMAAEVAYINALIAEIDSELVDNERTQEIRVHHTYTDPHSAGQIRRRSDRAALRELPKRLGRMATTQAVSATVQVSGVAA